MGERDPSGKFYTKEESEGMADRFVKLTDSVVENPPKNITLTLLAEWHAFFSEGVEGMVPGKFRTSMPAVFGGFRGCPQFKVIATMESFVRDINKISDSAQMYYENVGKDEKFIDYVIKMSSFIHARFVNIHPFYDGNGRMSRLMQVWLLSRFKISALPVFDNPEEYYKALNEYHLLSTYEPLYQLSLRLIAESAQRLGRNLLN